LDKLPSTATIKMETEPGLALTFTGISIPAQVSYVAYVLPAPAYIDPASALLMISAKELSNNYLYKHIRVQGGAYGGMSSFDSSLGLFSFLPIATAHCGNMQVYKDAQASIPKMKFFRGNGKGNHQHHWHAG